MYFSLDFLLGIYRRHIFTRILFGYPCRAAISGNLKSPCALTQFVFIVLYVDKEKDMDWVLTIGACILIGRFLWRIE